jgi:ADP-ribose pyrophosphatase
MTDARTVTDFEVESDGLHGAESGFLQIRRVRLRNIRADGSRSAAYVCDFVQRPKGLDAVVVALWHRDAAGRVHVLLRCGLRPALVLGRDPEAAPIPETAEDPYVVEVVAGIVERQDRGRGGVLRRAAIEVAEEAGYDVDPDAVEFLGAGVFPSPGSMPEKFWLTVVEIADREAGQPPRGDGSPMEEGGRILWMPLEAAIEACVAGDIQDAKTELCLRRLRDRLDASPASGGSG